MMSKNLVLLMLGLAVTGCNGVTGASAICNDINAQLDRLEEQEKNGTLNEANIDAEVDSIVEKLQKAAALTPENSLVCNDVIQRMKQNSGWDQRY